MSGDLQNNVVSLFGAEIHHPKADDEVVEKLRELLAKAESGSLIGFAFVEVDAAGNAPFGWVGKAEAQRLITGIARLNHRALSVSLQEFEGKEDEAG
jgi:hypothetical protein